MRLLGSQRTAASTYMYDIIGPCVRDLTSTLSTTTTRPRRDLMLQVFELGPGLIPPIFLPFSWDSMLIAHRSFHHYSYNTYIVPFKFQVSLYLSSRRGDATRNKTMLDQDSTVAVSLFIPLLISISISRLIFVANLQT